MTQFLSWLTILVNLLGLAVTLCLGLYVVTRTPRKRLSWLAALMLWALTGFYLYNTLTIAAPGEGTLPLLRLVVLIALALGFHLILLMPPERERSRRGFYLPPLRLPAGLRRRLGRREAAISRLGVPLAYSLALLLALGGAFPPGLPPPASDGPAIYLSDRTAGPLYPFTLAYLALLGAMAATHLIQSRKEEQGNKRRRRYRPYGTAVVLTGLGGLYLGLGVWFQWTVPSLPADAAVGVAGLILGYMVARYNAVVEGRDIRRDLLYISLVIGFFTLSYVIVAEILFLVGHTFSTVTLLLIIVAAVSSLMLYDGLRTTLDRVFYRQQFRELRANLRGLARETGVGQTLSGRLQALLGALCHSMRIQRGLIGLSQGDRFVCAASEGAGPVDQTFPTAFLAAEEAVVLPRPSAPGPEGMELLVPIYAGNDQIGALVLGPKETGVPFAEEDLLLLDDLADQLAAVIQTYRLQEENARAISEMVSDFRQREQILQRQVQEMLAERDDEPRVILDGVDEKGLVSLVEDALRRLHDYSYLGEHALARLQVVTRELEGRDAQFVTHIDRGKALSKILRQAIDKLRPPGQEPSPRSVPSQEWHPFLVLHSAYVEGVPNRDIMSWLYISEGTFNRTRRRAVRSVAKALQEMETSTVVA